jgi:hypothetical protein
MLGRIWRAIQDWAATTTRRRRRAYLVFLLLLDASLLVMSAVNYFHHRHDAGHFDGFITCSWCLVAFANAFAFGGTPLRFHSITSWNQRAQIEFGKAYSELTKREQLIVRAETAREIREGVRPPDERDALLQRGAEQRAFQVLKIVLPIFLVAYWVTWLSFSSGPIGTTLFLSAIVMTLMTMFVVILPNAIRLWTEADEAGEPRVVTEREA